MPPAVHLCQRVETVQSAVRRFLRSASPGRTRTDILPCCPIRQVHHLPRPHRQHDLLSLLRSSENSKGGLPPAFPEVPAFLDILPGQDKVASRGSRLLLSRAPPAARVSSSPDESLGL